MLHRVNEQVLMDTQSLLICCRAHVCVSVFVALMEPNELGGMWSLCLLRAADTQMGGDGGEGGVGGGVGGGGVEGRQPCSLFTNSFRSLARVTRTWSEPIKVVTR